jgi:hypothetical protein
MYMYFGAEHPDDIGAPFDLPPLARTGQSPTSQPFIWTKSADEIFASMQKYLGPIVMI